MEGVGMEAFEYAIKKDIRNNPIVREVDEARVREMWRSASVGALAVVVLLLSAWQHFELIRYGYRIDQVQKARATEEETNRHLRLTIQTLERPDRIEQLASSQLKMQQPGPDDTIVLERVQPAEGPARSIVAERR